MLEPIRDDVELAQSLNPDLGDLLDKLGGTDIDLIRYLPGMMKTGYYQGVILQHHH